jgi:hypothetical protein
MSKEQLTIVFRNGQLSVNLVLNGIMAVLEENRLPLTGFAMYGERTSIMDALSRLRKARRSTFNIVGHGFSFHLASVHNFDLDFLEIASTTGSRITWDEWAQPFIGSDDFIMAWLADSEYEHWQNADDPLQYTSAGKSYEHLPMVSNGLPYPLERRVIDTSANPGRRILRRGYIEVVGAVMWLGEPFWSLTGADRKQVENAPWLEVSHPTPSVIKLQVGEPCFTSAEGAGGQLQAKLRSLLFPKAPESTGPR